MSNYLVNLIHDPRCTGSTLGTAPALGGVGPVGGATVVTDTSWSADGSSGSFHVSGSASGFGIAWMETLSQPGPIATFALTIRAGASGLTGATLQVSVPNDAPFSAQIPDLSAYEEARVPLAFAVPANASQATFQASGGGAGEFWVDAIVVAMGDTDPGPFDGTLPKAVQPDGTSFVYVWQGAADASPTVRYVMQEVLPAAQPVLGPQPTQSPTAGQDLWETSYAIADAQNPNGILLQGVTAASITGDWFSATKETLNLTVLRHPNLSGYLADWPTASIIPSKVNADGTATQLGVFVVTDVQDTVDEDGAYALAVVAEDRTVLLSGNVWMDSKGNPATASFARGSNLLSIINQILACAGLAPIRNADAATSSATLKNDFTYPSGTDLLTMANDLLRSTGFRAITVKSDGTFFIAPSTSLSLRTTQWTHSGALTDGPGSRRAPGFGLHRNLFGVPNKVVCVSTQFGDASLGLTFTSQAVDTNPASPFSYLPNPDPSLPPIRGWRTKVYTDIAVDNQAALDKIAKQYLAQLQGQSRTATVRHLYLDGFDLGTSVLFSDSTSGQATADALETPDSFLSIVTSQTVDLMGMGITSSTLLEITSGVTDWNDGSAENLGLGTTDQYITP